jgi:predicted Zn-dependent protease
VRFGSDVYRFIFAAKTMTAPSDRAFREAVNTFRRMSLKESSAVHPLRLKIVTVRADDTPEKLARRMAITDQPLERFLVLNGLHAGEKLKAGDKVKLVVE